MWHRTAWDHYKMENHPKKYPAAPKIPSSVDTTKYPAWSFQIWHPWQHGTTKMENFLHPTLKYRVAPKYPSLSIPQNTQFGVFLSTSLGFWDIGQHGTTIKWKTTPKNTQLPQKYLALSIQQNTQLGVFLSTSLGFGTWQHGTTIKLFFSILP